MKIEMEIDIEKFRFSLIGDGYIQSEVGEMSEDRLVGILTTRINNYIDGTYYKGKRIGLY